MSPDQSCTVLVHNITCCGKYRILQVLIDLCNSLFSDYDLDLKTKICVLYCITLQYCTSITIIRPPSPQLLPNPMQNENLIFFIDHRSFHIEYWTFTLNIGLGEPLLAQFNPLMYIVYRYQILHKLCIRIYQEFETFCGFSPPTRCKL